MFPRQPCVTEFVESKPFLCFTISLKMSQNRHINSDENIYILQMNYLKINLKLKMLL